MTLRMMMCVRGCIGIVQQEASLSAPFGYSLLAHFGALVINAYGRMDHDHDHDLGHRQQQQDSQTLNRTRTRLPEPLYKHLALQRASPEEARRVRQRQHQDLGMRRRVAWRRAWWARDRGRRRRRDGALRHRWRHLRVRLGLRRRVCRQLECIWCWRCWRCWRARGSGRTVWVSHRVVGDGDGDGVDALRLRVRSDEEDER